MDTITVYGKHDCVDFLRSKALLDGHEIPFTFHDVVKDPAAATLAESISGGTSTPVIVFADGSYQVEPTDEQLAARLV